MKSATVLWIFLILFSGVSQAAKKTFIYCSEGSPSSFNPQIVTDGTSFNAGSKMIFNRLVEFETGTTNLVPGLAKSWTISKDNLTYTFKLRSGVKFHSSSLFTPTRDFNADDVLFSFDRQRDKQNPYHNIGGGSYEYFNSMDMGNLIKSIRKVDELTVQFVLTRPEAPFLANLAMDFASIHSKEYADKMLQNKTPDNVDTHPIGTGPFVFLKYSKDQMIRYRANQNYFQGPSPLDQVVFVITPDASVRYQKLKVGECHLIAYPSPTDLEGIRKNADLKILEQEGLNVGYLAMNISKPPLNKLLVRKAIHHALNRKAYIAAVYMNTATVAKNPIPPTLWSYNNAVKDYDLDIAKAKTYIKKAGYPSGFEIELWTLPVSRPYNPNGRKMGEMMQADLAKVGIRAKLISYDWPTYLAKSKLGEHQLLQMGWTGDNGDPDNFLHMLLSCEAKQGGSNRSEWCDAEFDQLVKEAKQTTNIKKRTELYKKAQQRFKSQIPWVTLAHAKIFRAMRTNVVGYKIDPLGSDTLYGVDLK